MLRTGIGLDRGYSRRQVARIVHVSLEREGRIERQATAALTRASKEGRCAGPVAALRTAVLNTLSALLGITRGVPPSGNSASIVATGGARQMHRHGLGPRPDQGPSTANFKSATVAPPHQSGLDPLLLALASLSGGLLVLWLRRSRVRSQPELGGVIGLAALRQGKRNRGALLAPSPEKEIPISPRKGDDASAVPPDGGGRPPTAAVIGGIAAFELGGALAEKGDMTGAEAAFRRADAEGHPSAASNLGVLLEQRGDFVGAEAAYRRADNGGDAIGAFNLGAMLADRDDLVGAEEAFRRADQRGDAAGTYAIGSLLEARNDIFGAEAAFRRADDRGHPSAASSLGMLLENRSDLTAAEAAYLRADERGDATGAFKLGAMLEQRDDFRGAEAAYSRAADRGQGYVADLANAALSLLRSDR
jgi:TPR repeat protein